MKLRSHIAASLVCVGLATAAGAYIPSAASLLRRAAARVNEGGKSKEAALSGWLTIADQAPVNARLTLSFPLGCALDANGKTASFKAGKTEDGGLGSQAAELLTLVCPLIANRGLNANDAELALRGAAQRAGVPAEFLPTSLARLYDRVAIVLGAGPRQLDRPQLWLYKETSAPARLLAKVGDQLHDLRLLQYGNPAAGEWFPRSIELWQGEALLARFESLSIAGFKDTPPAEEQDDE